MDMLVLEVAVVVVMRDHHLAQQAVAQETIPQAQQLAQYPRKVLTVVACQQVLLRVLGAVEVVLLELQDQELLVGLVVQDWLH
jgi:predicted Na+-dependent transporter